MAQLLGAKELHSFVANLLIIYDYVYDTEVDIWTAGRFLEYPVHFLMINKLNAYIMKRRHKNNMLKGMY
jgi:hypothetical protein